MSNNYRFVTGSGSTPVQSEQERNDTSGEASLVSQAHFYIGAPWWEEGRGDQGSAIQTMTPDEIKEAIVLLHAIFYFHQEWSASEGELCCEHEIDDMEEVKRLIKGTYLEDPDESALDFLYGRLTAFEDMSRRQ